MKEFFKENRLEVTSLCLKFINKWKQLIFAFHTYEELPSDFLFVSAPPPQTILREAIFCALSYSCNLADEGRGRQRGPQHSESNASLSVPLPKSALQPTDLPRSPQCASCAWWSANIIIPWQCSFIKVRLNPWDTSPTQQTGTLAELRARCVCYLLVILRWPHWVPYGAVLTNGMQAPSVETSATGKFQAFFQKIFVLWTKFSLGL